MTESGRSPGSGSAIKVARNIFLRYGLGLLAAILALVVRFPLWVIVGTTRPYLTFYPAIILSSWYCGFGPGVVTAILSALFVFWKMDGGTSNPDYFTGLMFLVAGSMTAAISNYVISDVNSAAERSE